MSDVQCSYADEVRARELAEQRQIERAEEPPFTCAARKQGTAGGNDPADCDWPTCGCDPYATKVIVALRESGWWSPSEVMDAGLPSRVGNRS